MPAKRARSFWRRFARFLALGALIGFGYVAYIYLTLPDVRPLAKTNPTTTAFMELRKEEARDEGRQKFTIRQNWINYRSVSPFLRRAVIVTEDAAFFDHDGIDLAEIKASLEKNWEEGQFLRGGSTITQQLAKNLYLSPSRNPVRKLSELLIARRLEAALLAGAIINPRVHSPSKPTQRLLRRQQIILRRMQYKPPPPVLPPGNQTPFEIPPADFPSPPLPGTITPINGTPPS